MTDGVAFRLGTFSLAGGRPFAGLLLDGQVIRSSDATASRCETLLEVLDEWDATFPAMQKLASEGPDRIRGRWLPVEQLRVHAPIPQPRTLYCSGANYKKHVMDLIVAHDDQPETRGMTSEQKLEWGARRMDERGAHGTPFIFTKPQSSVTGPFDRGVPGFLPMGPYLTPAAFVSDPQQLRLTLKLNGRVMQDEETSDMIFPVARLIEYLSANVELQPGDVICTGSPAGNGMHYGRFISDRDILEGTITGPHIDWGTQRNPCVAEQTL